MKIDEWSIQKRWNPFNSYKLLAQVYRWRKIQRGKPIPQPVLVTVDPINACDLRCVWCNSEFVIDKRKGRKLSTEMLLKIADFLSRWQGSPEWEKGVEAVCIAGGGEPLLHEGVGKFIEALREKGIEAGVVTNGTMIHRFIPQLSECTWVGVSVDAGSAETFARLKKRDLFHQVIKNMEKLINYSERNKTWLGREGQGYGVSYKYLLYPGNIHEVYQAAKLAKEIGCRNFHLRPMGVPWDKVGKVEKIFSEDDLKLFQEQVEKARTLEDENFGVFTITHKFDPTLHTLNAFPKCYAIFMTCVFMPPQDNNPSHFTLGLCCDRRGDELLELGKNLESVEEVAKLWGSEKHWEIFDKIDVSTCPRCTYQPHNQIFEYVIKRDFMTYKFI
ncbi:MAG TPA: radical SAM protein [bacterium]|nr:radical SAM protein [bacterium]HEX68221.1 radical SAM protein [bacterium]